MIKHAGRISRASQEFVSGLEGDTYKISELRNQFDYIYQTRDLAELKGKQYDGKRNHIKRFKAAHPDYEYSALDAPRKKEALELFERWFEARKESRFYPKLAYTSQKAALEIAFENFEKLRLSGGAVSINKKLEGFIIGSRLNDGTLSAHFSYGNPAMQGISQILLFEACNKTFAPYKYVNLEQDLGIPGLRTAKLSNHPLRLEKKFEVVYAKT